MGLAYGSMQKALWIEYRVSILGKTVRNGFACHLCRFRPISMAAHSVGDNQQCSVLVLYQNDPILIFLTASDKAEFCVFKLQRFILIIRLFSLNQPF